MSRTKGARNKKPTLDGRIYVRCEPELKEALAKVMRGKSESQKVVSILKKHLGLAANEEGEGT